MANEQDTAGVRTELIDRMRRSWEELQAALAGLDDRLLDAAGPDGWSVKDHLVHLERWEAYMLAELDGRGGRPELGLPEGGEDPGTDAINAALRARHADVSPAEARRRLADTHTRAAALLGALDGSELRRRTEWIAGNTYEHYEEHLGSIRTLSAASSG